MILARLLAGAGILSRHGILCATCREKPEQRAMLGCGEAPKIRFFDYDANEFKEIEWSGRWYEDLCHENESQPDDAQAQTFYRFAPLGWAKRLTGEYWDWCPRWFDVFSPLRYVADDIIGVALDIERGLVPSLDLATSTSRLRRDVRIALDAIRRIRQQEDEERHETQMQDLRSKRGHR